MIQCNDISGEEGYCVPKENCSDLNPDIDGNNSKCNSSENDTCCKKILPRNKCILWRNSEPENTINKSKIEKIKNANIFNSQDCGISSATGLNRIAYGKKTLIAEYPWMAMLYHKVVAHKEIYFYSCGGSLISDKIVSINH